MEEVRNSEQCEPESLSERYPYLGDPHRRMIYIPAIPSSGTSCVAGILFNLGVNMGRLEPAGEIRTRGYYMFEDAEIWQFLSVFNEAKFDHGAIEPNPKEIVLERHIRFRDYVNYRFLSDAKNRVGFKAPATFWMLDPEPESLPIDIVDVRRPLEDAIRADDRTLRTRTSRNPDASEPTIHHRALRSGSLGTCYMARDILCDMHEPKARLEFYDVLAAPDQAVAYLIDKLDLEPTDQQIATAIGYVNPQMRHV